MHQAKRWRYYCDFCGKTGGRRDAIEHHERHCTMNPERVCGVCRYGRRGQTESIEELKVVFDGLTEFDDFEDRLKHLRELVDGCPACILAVMRQSGNMNYGFDYKAEMQQWFEDRKDEWYSRI